MVMQVTSLAKELGREVTVEEVTPVLLESFSHVFGNEWTVGPENAGK
jgi:lipoate-protein ligase B